MKALFRWLNRKLRVVETEPEANAYYAWADARLDHIAEHERWAKRGVRLACKRPGCYQ